MKERHVALIVEDDKETAEDLVEILRSIECDGVIVDNHEDALSTLQSKSFCLILLDLQIKSESSSIKGHVEHGRALLRKFRQAHGDHNGTAFWLPVLIVSGFAREADEAVEVMKNGASDVIQKPIENQQVSDRIRRALEASGRLTHALCCDKPPTQRPDLSKGVLISIPGDRIGRRTRVMVGPTPVDITDASLKVLLHLMVALRKGSHVHKIDLGATADQGFKGVSNLRNELKSALAGTEIIKNHYHGNYSFNHLVTIGECVVDSLLRIGDAKISNLAKQLRKTFRAGPKKV
jgi:DNA-binding response OmpR family regulator